MGRGARAIGQGQGASSRTALRTAEQEAQAYELALDQHSDWLNWASTHDYDPSWDYTIVFEYRDHPLLRIGQGVADRICADADAAQDTCVPFGQVRVYPVVLDGAVAMYANGTSSEPVVLLDIDAYDQLPESERPGAIADSVLHELRHAVQESLGISFDEDDAEHGAKHLPF